MEDKREIAKMLRDDSVHQATDANDASGTKGRPYLKMESVTKKFGEFTAIKDVSLVVYEGELVCFVGPSGCGKTTLLRAIAGLDMQTSGRIVQAGKDISRLPPTERDFGIVFQSYALFPNLTVKKNIAYGLENRKVGKAEIQRRVAELLCLVGLQDQGDKYPAQLSGGEQQRVALTRSLATSPGLLLLDEPLSALDAKVRVRLRREIKNLQRRIGVTTIMVTHDQEEALTIADRIVIMNHGVIEQFGTPVEVYRNPATAFVADFIGIMNLVPGTVIGQNRIRLGQAELACDTEGMSKGTAVSVAVRPEDIVVQDVTGDEENAFEARVDSMEFLGAFYRADLTDGAMGESRLRADFSINLVRRKRIREGDFLKVVVPWERIRIYPGRVSHG